MRHSFLAAVAALAVFIPSGALAQGTGPGTGLTVTNYRLVNEQRFSLFESYFTYSAELINSGGARSAITASLASKVPSVKTVNGQNRLHFPPVPAGGRVTSLNTFTILVDRRVPFSFDNLEWTFLNPIANAGPDQTGVVGATITLNGSASSNPSGVGTLSYLWQFLTVPAGSNPQFTAPTNVVTTFILTAPGTYVVQLTVSNGVGSEVDTVVISTTNSKPVANAGANQTVAVGSTVTLNGSGSSDVDGDPLTFAWILISRPANSTATLTNANTVSPTFIADRAGTYVAQLIVNDGKVNSDPATVTITTSNTPPVANAGNNQTVNVGSTVQLNGAGSTDVDGDPLTFQWSLITIPSGSTATLSSTTIVNPTFVADRPGTYVAQLIVNDGKINSAPSTVTISTNAVQPPTANAGPAQTVKRFQTVNLAGSGTDPQSLPLTFQWSLTTRPTNSNATLTNPNTANPTFVADQHGTYIAQLIVNNGFLNSAPATVTITTSNTPPVANAGPNQSVTAGALVTLNGSGSSDADQDPLTFSWSFTSRPEGSAAVLNAPTSSSPTFVADLPGTYVVQLIVNDGQTASAPATVTITAASPGSLAVPSNTNLTLGQSAVFPVSLPAPAGPGGVTVTLTSNDTQKVTVNPTTVNIAAGQTQPATQPQVTGVGLGQTTITATAPAYTQATGTVQVTATIVFNPAALPMVAGQTQNLALNLSANAPAGGVTVNLVSDTPAVATVPATVQIPAGANTVNVPVTAVAAGTAKITASGASLNNTVADITVNAVLTITTTSLPAGVVGTPYSQTLGATGGKTPYTWSITSGTLPAGLTLNASTGQITGTPTAAVSNTPLTFRVADTGPPNQTATVNLTLTINPQTPTSITATSGTPQSASVGTAFANQLRATVRDANNNPVPGVTVTFTAPAQGASGTFAGGANTAVTDASGVATSAVFTANNTAGSYKVNATVTGVATPAEFNLTNNPGPAASITATGGTPQSATVGTAFATVLSATVRDANNNPVPGVTVTFTPPANGASGTFANGTNTAVTNASGVASSVVFTANTTAGTYNVVATAPGVTGGANFALTNTAGPPASITATGGTPQSVVIGTQFASPLVATVRDANNNPVSGATVTFSPPAGGASGTFANGVNTAITNASGVATSALFTANNTAGSYNVAATVTGVATAVNFALTNTPGAPASVTATSGGGQSAIVNTQFSNPLVATVRDAGNNPVPNVTVTFTAPASGASAVFAGGANTAVTNANGVATSVILSANATAGNYNVTASVQGVAAAANYSLTNLPVGGGGSITVTSASVGKNLQAPLTVTLPSDPPPAGINVTITSSNPNLVISGRSSELGTTNQVLLVNTKSFIVFAQALNNTGSATINVSATGFTAGSATVTMTPSGFVISGPNGIGVLSFTIPQSLQETLTVSAARLQANLSFAEVQAVRPGLPGAVQVVISNSTPTVGTVSPTQLNFGANDSALTTRFTALVPGATTLTAEAPADFSVPALNGNRITANVTPAGLVALNATVGQNLQTTTRVRLNSPAPPGGVQITVTTSDATKLVFSDTPTGPDRTSLTLTAQQGTLGTPEFFVRGLVSTGTVNYTATATGLGTVTGTITMTPSGFVITGPFGTGANFFTTTGAANTDLRVDSVRLDETLMPAEFQPVRGGLPGPVAVNVTSSNPGVGVITVSPLNFGAGAEFAVTQFDPISGGTTTISVNTPPGFSTPVTGRSMVATVQAPGIGGLSDLIVGNRLQAVQNLTLGQPAPTGGLQVTITVTSGSILLSTSPTTAGSPSITLTVPAGQSFSPDFYVQGTASSGTATYQVSAPGYTSRTGKVDLYPSAIVISGPFGVGNPLIMSLTSPPSLREVFVTAGVLNPLSGTFLGSQAVAGGQNISVVVNNNNTAIGTVASPIAIPNGAEGASAIYNPIALGEGLLSVVQPTGFSIPAAFSSVVVKVQ